MIQQLSTVPSTVCWRKAHAALDAAKHKLAVETERALQTQTLTEANTDDFIDVLNITLSRAVGDPSALETYLFKVLRSRNTLRGSQLCEAASCIQKHSVWAAISKTREECVTVS